ncbi:hypothetical protein GCM10027160_33200 [Streptomyces calidiresistens]|uniref:Uncharacterized protein n=1 Tax=Streptomyces calidiresistens TaxID=1485586 RepID=A0A7W3T0W7_9ACTN|nr:hypothetical protein [Streptomyces calidiresistens]MBB0228857.1 hypothetical protein [Streptomyces calidiresistens]
MERIVSTTVGRTGIEEVITLEIREGPPSGITAYREGRPGVEYTADDLTLCLLGLRRELEREGLLLCCQGARRDAVTSGSLKQMTNGWYVYIANPESGTVNPEPVDILAPADPIEVATCDEQRAAVFAFHGLRDRGGEEPHPTGRELI